MNMLRKVKRKEGQDRMTNWTKRQKEQALLVLSILFFIALTTFSYFTLFAPAKEANAQMKLMAANERDVLVTLQKKVASTNQADSVISQPLQRKVPVKAMEDLIVLQIEKAAIKSNSTIKAVTFSPEEFIFPDPSGEVSNLHQLLTEIVLEADAYLDVEKFIDEIEQMERIFVVDSIHFDVPKETREVGTETDPFQVTISFTAFYRPDLVNLQHELPKIDVPKSADKIDPTPFNGGENEGDVQ
jgi:type IV pilus assembly protein PilO